MKKEPAGWGGLRLDHIREMLALGTNLARRIYTPIRSCVQADFVLGTVSRVTPLLSIRSVWPRFSDPT